MKMCEQRDEMQANLKAAFEQWYRFKDVPGKNRETKDAEKKIHHIQRSLGDHVPKHGCNRD
jgi:hypothetical protein